MQKWKYLHEFVTFIYKDMYKDRKLNVFCTEDAHACVTAPEQAFTLMH